MGRFRVLIMMDPRTPHPPLPRGGDDDDMHHWLGFCHPNGQGKTVGSFLVLPIHYVLA